MTRLRIPLLPLLLPASFAYLACPVEAVAQESWLLAVDPGVAVPVSEPQTTRFNPGPTAGLGLYRSFAPWVLAGMRARATGLFTSGDTSDPRLAPAEDGGLYTALGALRVRPFGTASGRGDGLYLEVGAGPGLTGEVVRAVIEPGIGYGIDLGAANVGPGVRYQHVFQPDDALLPEDGRFLTLGVEITLFDAKPVAPPAQEKAKPRRPPPKAAPKPELPTLAPCPDEPVPADELPAHCPDPDPDEDGIPTARDDCPFEAEVFNGINDHDGCPDTGELEVVNDRLTISSNVFFDYDQARVRWSATPILMEVADLWKSHPEWIGMVVEGHADERGDADYNLGLSERRAAAVAEVLALYGLDPETITTRGLGEQQPHVVGASSELDHQLNRRVELVVIREQVPNAPILPPPSPDPAEETDPDSGDLVADAHDAPAPPHRSE